MNQEWPTVVIFPPLQKFDQLGLNLWQVLGNPLAHLLFSQQAGGITFLASLSLHEARSILTRRCEILAVLNERAMFVY